MASFRPIVLNEYLNESYLLTRQILKAYYRPIFHHQYHQQEQHIPVPAVALYMLKPLKFAEKGGFKGKICMSLILVKKKRGGGLFGHMLKTQRKSEDGFMHTTYFYWNTI